LPQKDPSDKLGPSLTPFSLLTKAFFQASSFLLLPFLLGLLWLLAFFQALSFLLLLLLLLLSLVLLLLLS
jgi:hypothetical protein